MDQITCRKCGDEIGFENIDIENETAVCTSCGEVYRFGDLYEGEDNDSDNQPPKGVAVVETEDGIEITTEAEKVAGIVIGIFALIWDGVLFGVFLPVFLDIGGVAPLFLIPFVAAGGFLPYLALVMYRNTRTVSVSEARLEIVSKPMPWFGNVAVNRNDIQQLFVKKQYHRAHRSAGHGRRSVGTSIPAHYSYDLYVLLADGARKILMSLQTMRSASFYERTIENHLGIEDAPVSSEPAS